MERSALIAEVFGDSMKRERAETHEINATINFPAEWLNYTTEKEKREYAAKLARRIENQMEFDLLMDIFEKNGE